LKFAAMSITRCRTSISKLLLLTRDPDRLRHYYARFVSLFTRSADSVLSLSAANIRQAALVVE
jgi:hypothetical protein